MVEETQDTNLELEDEDKLLTVDPDKVDDFLATTVWKDLERSIGLMMKDCYLALENPNCPLEEMRFIQGQLRTAKEIATLPSIMKENLLNKQNSEKVEEQENHGN
jgi:hypothetical protein